VAQDKAQEIKSLIRDNVGAAITVSIGLAPNRFIAKLASKLKKPDGLVCIDFKDLPLALYPMDLPDITGIGPRMLRRLHSARILDMEGLYAASRRKIHRIWGSVEGDRMWYALRGIELPPVETRKSTIGHSHVLPPKLRTFHGGHATLHRMLQKACRRLRADGYFAGCLIVQVKFGFELRWAADTHCFPTQDSVALGHLLDDLWADRPDDVPNPTKVGITLTKLVPETSHTRSRKRLADPFVGGLGRLQPDHKTRATEQSPKTRRQPNPDRRCQQALIDRVFDHVKARHQQGDTPHPDGHFAEPILRRLFLFGFSHRRLFHRGLPGGLRFRLERRGR